MQKTLKYIGHSIVFQEVPNEVTLAISITGCPIHCKDCHSKYLWEDTGRYIRDDIQELLDKYKDTITCVCFMGGDRDFDCIEELKELCYICRVAGYKTALYTGNRLSPTLISFGLYYLNYIKVGEYNEQKGGLEKPTTNQKMFRITTEDNINIWEDITSFFWKGEEHKAVRITIPELFKYSALSLSEQLREQKLKEGEK